jgi:hypothetical protein
VVSIFSIITSEYTFHFVLQPLMFKVHGIIEKNRAILIFLYIVIMNTFIYC